MKRVERKRARAGRRKLAAQIEACEPRRLLSVVINELVAGNTIGIVDSDGTRQDWIELRNTASSAVDLSGWYLTDDLSDRTKWQFPSTTLPADGYLVVFASDKNRSVAGQELHTNFKLTSAGETVALVMPDGTTIADSFAPFPAVKDDRSFGIAKSDAATVTETLVGATSPLKVISPTSRSAATDDFWRNVGFNDAAWISGVRSVGFDRDGTVSLNGFIGTTLSEAQMPSTSSPRYTAYVRYAFDLAAAAQLTSLTMQVRYDDGFIGYLNGKEFFRTGFQDDDARPSPQWDARANQNRADVDTIVPLTVDMTAYLPLLVDGPNVLAFHAVNSASTTSSSINVRDFLLEPVVTATRASGPASAQFMDRPTPGAENGVGTLGFVGDTHFSVDRGFYDAPFQLAITSNTPGAQIYYTLNGSAPAAGVGSLCSGPITVTTTTTLRAIATKPGHVPSNVDTVTYVFLDDVIQQSDAYVTQPFTFWGHDKEDADLLNNEPDWAVDPDVVNDPVYAASIKNDLKAIPSMSLVMDWNDLFNGNVTPGTNNTQGIYILGKGFERYSHVEYFNATGTDQWHTDAAVEMQGHSSTTRWNSDKMSFELKFKFPYGSTKLEHPIFAGTPDGANAATRFDSLILDAMYNYTWIHANHRQAAVARFVTDQVVADLQNLAGGRAPHGKFVHLYLNGLYWGLYLLHEKPGDGFADAYYGGNKDDYDVIRHNPTPDFTPADGGVTAIDNYTAFINATRQNMASASNYAAVEALLDVDDFIDYMIVHYYAGNNDWAHNNWYASRNRVVPGSKWHFHEWDQEHAFPTDDNAHLGDTIGEDYDSTGKDDPFAPTEIHINLMANPEYKLKFADRAQRLLFNGGLLTPASAAAVFQTRVNEIDRAIVGESARWGDNRVPITITGSQPYARNTPYTRADWVATMNGVLADFFPVRTQITLSQFISRGWMPSLAAPLMNQYGGSVSAGFQLTLTKPVGSPAAAKIYYTLDGSDPRLPGGTIAPAAVEYTSAVTLSTTTRVRARIIDGSSASAEIDATFLSDQPFPVRIVELHYHPANHPNVVDDEDLEFFELLNTGNQAVSLDGVRIVDFANPGYSFPAGLTLAPGERIVVARDPAVFQTVYGNNINLAPAGYDPANLSNGGERVRLLGPAGETIQDFTYDDVAPWPTSPDGGGPSLEIIDPLGDPADAANWRASSVNGGTPGTGAADTTSPTVLEASFDVDQNRFVIQFSEDVLTSLQASDLAIEPLSGGASITPVSVTFDPADYMARFALSAPLHDGNYRIRIAAGTITDAAGNALAAFDQTDPDFYALAGDANRDRHVNLDDFTILAANFGQTGRLFSHGNFNYSQDGAVNLDDFTILASQFGTNLPAASDVPRRGASPLRQSPFSAEKLTGNRLDETWSDDLLGDSDAPIYA